MTDVDVIGKLLTAIDSVKRFNNGCDCCADIEVQESDLVIEAVKAANDYIVKSIDTDSARDSDNPHRNPVEDRRY
jgi:hypothetical protein